MPLMSSSVSMFVYKSNPFIFIVFCGDCMIVLEENFCYHDYACLKVFIFTHRSSFDVLIDFAIYVGKWHFLLQYILIPMKDVHFQKSIPSKGCFFTILSLLR